MIRLLSPYLKDNDRPLTVGDVITTSVGVGEDKTIIRWKVLELEPDAANSVEAARGTVTAGTTIFTDGEPLAESEANTLDDIVGYEDIGGLDRQMAIIRELIDLRREVRDLGLRRKQRC